MYNDHNNFWGYNCRHSRKPNETIYDTNMPEIFICNKNILNFSCISLLTLYSNNIYLRLKVKKVNSET